MRTVWLQLWSCDPRSWEPLADPLSLNPPAGAFEGIIFFFDFCAKENFTWRTLAWRSSGSASRRCGTKLLGFVCRRFNATWGMTWVLQGILKQGSVDFLNTPANLTSVVCLVCATVGLLALTRRLSVFGLRAPSRWHSCPIQICPQSKQKTWSDGIFDC